MRHNTSAYPAQNPTSSLLYQKKLVYMIEDLFTKLDTDGDGLISSDRICIDFLDKSTLKAIAPMLFELEE
jgi:hypothetical protein